MPKTPRKITPKPASHTERAVTYVRFSTATLQRIDAMAAEEETNRSQVIRSLVLKALREASASSQKAA